MGESALLELARQGDLRAFNRLVVAYQDLVYCQAFYLLVEPRLAEAAARVTFEVAYRDLGSYRDSEAKLKLWLLRLVTDLCQAQSAGRGDCAPEPKDGPSLSPGASGAFDCGDLSDAARCGLLRLPPEQRAAVVLVDMQGLDYAEAAAVLHTSAGTLARRLAQGRLGLGRYLEQAQIEPVWPAVLCESAPAGTRPRL